mgnify:CR=1 FL=1
MELSEKNKLLKQRDMEWALSNANKKSERSERLSNFSLGFSIFTLVFILFVELIIKR